MAGPWKVEKGPTVDYSDYRPRSMPEENSSSDKPSPPKAVKKSPQKLPKESIEKSPNDSKPSTSKSTVNSGENISCKKQGKKEIKPRAMQEENSSGNEPSPPKAVKKSPKKLANKSIQKSSDDPKPSTSKCTANSEENISPNRQDSKEVKPGPMPDENSSTEDPFLPKAVKKSSKKLTKKSNPK